jgi:hypothetical protein
MPIITHRGVLAAYAVAAALTGALGLAACQPHDGADAASTAPGLVVQTGRDDDIRLDPARPLRCFVSGQYVGELALAECARRNGVPAGALDVGLDVSGALAAAHGDTAGLTPLPPPGADSPLAQAAGPPAAPCWRYQDAAWVKLAPMTLGACVQALFSGQCARPGAPAIGRWADRALRLAPGRVESSGDNVNFATLVQQGPGCTVPDAAAASAPPTPAAPDEDESEARS